VTYVVCGLVTGWI